MTSQVANRGGPAEHTLDQRARRGYLEYRMALEVESLGQEGIHDLTKGAVFPEA